VSSGQPGGPGPQVFGFARRVAARRGHDHVAVAHVVFGLTEAAPDLLRAVGVDVARLRSEAAAALPPPSALGAAADAPLPFASAVKDVLEDALDEYARIGHGEFGLEHLLLGLLRGRAGAAAGPLLAQGLDLDALRRRFGAPGPQLTGSWNVERKFRCADLAAARAAAEAQGARFSAVLEQIDTYFHATHGRLKLREMAGHRAELIWYDRADDEGARASHYRLAAVADAAALGDALGRGLGIRAIVRKRRELWMLGNVRIHLDDVADRGTFVEFEAVQGPGESEAASRERIEHLARALGLAEAVAVSYVDL